ncbi:MAG TPA: cytochrome P450 [Candidatus Acidoferrum sp.]
MANVPPPLSANEFFTPEMLKDPYPIYRRYLDGPGLQFLTIHGGVWAAFKHADCSTFLRDPRLSAKRTGILIDEFPAEKQKEFAELARTLSLWMLFFDAPEHTRLRKLMNKGFSPVGIESLRPQVEKIVDRLLTPLRTNHRIDLLPQLAHPLPAYVIAELLNVPESLHEKFIRWSNAVATLFGNPYRSLDDLVAAQQAIHGLTSYFREAVAVRRKQKGNDLISLLMEIEEDGDVLTEEELYAQCVMLLFGGHETTRNLIGNGLYTLLRHPEQAAELRDNPELIRTAIEELLRYESPVQYTGRMVLEDFEFCGVPARRGQEIIFMLGAANRDGSQFKDPERLDLKRARNPHLAFGAGAHFCIGNQLARLQGQVAVLKMLQEFPEMRSVSAEPEWLRNFSFRGLRTLVVEL